MAYDRQRLQLRNRCKREAHRVADTGAFSDASWNASIIDGWAMAWHLLVYSDSDSFGRATRTLTVTETSSTAALPSSFSELNTIAWIVGQTTYLPTRVRPSTAEKRGWYQNPPSLGESSYWIEGPGIEYDELSAQDVQYPQRIRMWPDLTTNDVVRIRYVTQAPSLGDPDDPADDTISIDLIWEPIERAVCAYARAVAAEREDAKDLQRAQGNLSKAITDVLESQGRRNNEQAFEASAFMNQGGR